MGLGAIKNKPAKLYPNRDITLAYIRDIHKGASKGEDWEEPKKPAPVTKKCLLIPQALWDVLGIDFLDSEDPPNDPGGNHDGSGGPEGGGPSPTPLVPAPLVTSPVTEVTCGNLDQVTNQTPYTASIASPSKGAGNLVTKNSDQKEKKEVSNSLKKSESCFSTKNTPQLENQVTEVTSRDSTPETLTSTTLQPVTSSKLPEVTQVTEPITPSEVTPSEGANAPLPAHQHPAAAVESVTLVTGVRVALEPLTGLRLKCLLYGRFAS